MIINEEQVKEMIINDDEFKIKVSLEVEERTISGEFERFYHIDNVIIDFKNQNYKYFINVDEVDEEIYKFFDYFLDVSHIDDIIKDSYNIHLLQYKKSDIDNKQKELFYKIENFERLIQEYDQLLDNNNLSTLLTEDLNYYIEKLYIKSTKLKKELNDYYYKNNYESSKILKDNFDRYEVLKKILK